MCGTKIQNWQFFNRCLKEIDIKFNIVANIKVALFVLFITTSDNVTVAAKSECRESRVILEDETPKKLELFAQQHERRSGSQTY